MLCFSLGGWEFKFVGGKIIEMNVVCFESDEGKGLGMSLCCA